MPTPNTETATPFVVPATRDSVVDRLDAVVPGGWDITLEEPRENEGMVEVRARLNILSVIRDAYGRGLNACDASDRAFLAAAALYRIGRTA